MLTMWLYYKVDYCITCKTFQVYTSPFCCWLTYLNRFNWRFFWLQPHDRKSYPSIIQCYLQTTSLKPPPFSSSLPHFWLLFNFHFLCPSYLKQCSFSPKFSKVTLCYIFSIRHYYLIFFYCIYWLSP